MIYAIISAILRRVPKKFCVYIYIVFSSFVRVCVCVLHHRNNKINNFSLLQCLSCSPSVKGEKQKRRGGINANGLPVKSLRLVCMEKRNRSLLFFSFCASEIQWRQWMARSIRLGQWASFDSRLMRLGAKEKSERQRDLAAFLDWKKK